MIRMRWKTMKCKTCGSEEPNIIALREHWRTDHYNSYVGVLHYLGEIDERNLLASKIAAEGMKGYGERSDAKKR